MALHSSLTSVGVNPGNAIVPWSLIFREPSYNFCEYYASSSKHGFFIFRFSTPPAKLLQCRSIIKLSAQICVLHLKVSHHLCLFMKKTLSGDFFKFCDWPSHEKQSEKVLRNIRLKNHGLRENFFSNLAYEKIYLQTKIKAIKNILSIIVHL